MGQERYRLESLQAEVLSVGQAFYLFQEDVERQSQKFFQKLEYLSEQIQREATAQEELLDLQYRVDRHRDHGEPLP